jgi:hypothetical protein
MMSVFVGSFLFVSNVLVWSGKGEEGLSVWVGLWVRARMHVSMLVSE